MSKALALIPAVETTLSRIEKARLDVLERIVEEGKVSFLAVGRALNEIRQDKLYRAAGSFELYAKERFGFARSRAFQLQAAAVCADTVHHGGLDLNERTLRPLTCLIDLRISEPTVKQQKQLVTAWARAAKLAGDKPVTGKHVKAAVEELVGDAPEERTRKTPRKTAGELSDQIIDLVKVLRDDGAYSGDDWLMLESRFKNLATLCHECAVEREHPKEK